MNNTALNHWGILITNQSDKKSLIRDLISASRQKPAGLEILQGKKGGLFSKLELDKLIEEEVKHDKKILTVHTDQSLQSFSSGERKKALFRYLMQLHPEFLILDNPFDHLDHQTQTGLKEMLLELSEQTHMVHLTSRAADFLPFINQIGVLMADGLQWVNSVKDLDALVKPSQVDPDTKIPAHPDSNTYDQEYLVRLKNVDVSYGENQILHYINWDIRPGEFWELSGKNGSGKTTILSMITGDNPKGYGQELYLFGKKKGSGESIWDIKKKIGYFTPAMIDRFRGYHSLENMLISGITDSIGLYIVPSEGQKRLAGEWLKLVGMGHLKDRYFHQLSTGQQRLIMCIRAMIKHPLLVILDEPTAGLDDASTQLIISLVNKMAQESFTTIIFVSHRKEPGLKAKNIFQLSMDAAGSTGEVIRK